MGFPICSECEKSLDNWSANVMVDTKYYPDVIPALVLICKECTNRLDSSGMGRRLWHNIWELSWVKTSYFDLQLQIFDEISNGRDRWSEQSLRDFNNLGRIIHGLEPVTKHDDYE